MRGRLDCFYPAMHLRNTTARVGTVPGADEFDGVVDVDGAISCAAVDVAVRAVFVARKTGHPAEQIIGVEEPVAIDVGIACGGICTCTIHAAIATAGVGVDARCIGNAGTRAVFLATQPGRPGQSEFGAILTNGDAQTPPIGAALAVIHPHFETIGGEGDGKVVVIAHGAIWFVGQSKCGCSVAVT